ncbi:MAG TPA: RNA polymerase sigma factor [Tepidisphaeraceae bacterium]|nr:RNA polymerase sigma factor [Tepidisphaeraceae bacterium]
MDLVLVDAARSGNRVAQATLLRELQDQWYRMVLRLLGNTESAREATQETALRFLKQLPLFEGRSEIRTWSLGIAINVAREMRREKEQDELTIDPPANGNGPHGELEQQERAQLVNRVIDSLPDRQREAVMLRFFEQLSVEQSATVMGCAPGTVKALVFQALRNMRQSLG